MSKTIYYNQNDYRHVPYPSPELPYATVKSGGCGVCCGAMIVSNLTSKQMDPEAMASYAMLRGARVAGGTDMNILAQALCSDFSLTYETTSDENELLAHLQAGGMAVVNVGGSRAGHTGVFSVDGHFIVAATCDGNWLTIMDPNTYPGKFNLAGRKGLVEVDGDLCYCDISVLAADTANRSPAYWLFRKKVEEVPEWMQNIMNEAKTIGLINSDHDPNEPAKKWFVLVIALSVIRILKG